MSLFYIFFPLNAILANLCVGGYNIRLPCKRSMNFTTAFHNISMIGTVIQSKQFLELSECKAECLANDECFSINYQMNDDNTCELNNMALDSLTVLLQHLTHRQGWSFMTSETKTRMRGSSCKELNPCRDNEWCTDTCSCPGFRCIQTTVAKDCNGYAFNGGSQSGVYWIQPDSYTSKKLQVFCTFDNDNEGWIVIQRRVDNKASFDRLWEEYKKGFGDLKGNYWIGLDNLNFLAGPARGARLRIDLRLSSKSSVLLYAAYNTFVVKNESRNYQLIIGEYSKSSTLPDSLTEKNSDGTATQSAPMFSTKDRDNDDKESNNCALECSGGWWFSSCRYSFLNGLLSNSSSIFDCSSVFNTNTGMYCTWFGTSSCDERIAFTEMKIKYN